MMEWPRVQLKSIVVDLQPGFACQPTDDPDGVLQLRTNNVSPDGRVDLSAMKRVAANGAQIEKYSLKPGDVLFNNTNSPALVGKTAIFNEGGLFLFSNHMTRIRFFSEVVEPRYVARYLHWAWSQGTFRALITQWVNQAAINRNQLLSVRVPLPPLSEQCRVVEILDQADRLRRLRTEADAKTDRLLSVLFVKMFGDPVTNPMGWPAKRFDKICESRLGKMLDQKQQTGQYPRPYLRNANVYWDRFDLQEILEMDFDESDREEFRLRKGDVLICEGGEVGRCAIWNDELPECYFQKALHRVRPHPDTATSEFLVYLLWRLAQRGALQDTVSKMTFSHLTGVKLKALQIPVPPFALQEKFAVQVRATKRALSQIALVRNRIGSLFDSLLHRAFSAELTASWREAHLKELVQEMEQQAKLLA